jgi:prevent-host-death family protein
MTVTSTEFKLNFGRYLELANREEIIITKNGKRIAKLVPDEEDLIVVAKSLFGIVSNHDIGGSDFKAGRIREHYSV